MAGFRAQIAGCNSQVLEQGLVSLASFLLVDPAVLEARVKVVMEYMIIERVSSLISKVCGAACGEQGKRGGCCATFGVLGIAMA